MSTRVYINVAVTDLDRSKSFFEQLGFAFDERFSDETGAAMTLNNTATAMLLTHQKFAQFTPRPIADAHTMSEMLTCLQVESRDAVDRMADAAVTAGGSRIGEPQEHGFLYGRAFADLDGHIWQVIWMDPAQVPAGS